MGLGAAAGLGGVMPAARFLVRHRWVDKVVGLQ